MSAFLDVAELIKARLESLTIFADVEVHIDRQKNIESMVAISVAKVKGATVVILWDGAGLVANTKLTAESRFIITAYGQPTLSPTAIPADELIEAALTALQGWKPSSTKLCYMEAEVITDADRVPHRTYVIYEFSIRIRVKLPTPQFNPPTP